MILAEIKSKSELNIINSDAIVINIAHFSSPSDSLISINEAKEIIKESTKPVFLKLLPLYKDEDYKELENLFKEIKGISGIIFQDLGLISLKNKYIPDALMIYDSNNFITSSADSSFFKDDDVDALTLSTTLSLKEVDEVLKDESFSYMAHAFGYIEMFYSYRKHFTNYSKKYNIINLKDDYDVYIKEESRDEYFKTIENDRGFYIFRDKKINLYDFLDHFKKCDYLLLDRIFINDEEYYDTINLYKGLIERNKYINKYKEKFDTGFLFKIVKKTY